MKTQAQIKESGIHSKRGESGSSHHCNVLVVDDEKMVRLSISLILKNSCNTVDTAEDGDIALDKIRLVAGNYQLLITDHAMKRTNGVELVKQLKQMGFPGKIIVLTGYLSSQEQAIYLTLGVDRIMYKPVDIVELRSAICELTAQS